jgi:uncharacterized protein
MEVKIDKRYDLPVSLDQAWALLRDVRGTATCMPGAEVTEQLDDTHYKGQVRSRIGPAVMTFEGQIEVLELDTGSRTMAMLGKGADRSGSSASMNMRTGLLPGETPQTCVLAGQATIVVSGRLAQFGSRLLLPVAETMLKTFVVNFSSKAATIELSDSALPPSADSTPPTQLNVMAVLWETLRQWWSRLWNRHPS